MTKREAEQIEQIFRDGSKTYFYSSKFFPREIRQDVYTLYAFVRTADNFVDSIPQQDEMFYDFRKRYNQAIGGKTQNYFVIDCFVELVNRVGIEHAWVDAFLDAMESDITKSSYETIQDTETYMYGSADVIGLMMAQIMRLPKESHHSAKMLGKSMQYINFIRDISEDIELGRTYLPLSEVHAAGLSELTRDAATSNPEAFKTFIHAQLDRHAEWQAEALEGFDFIPWKFRVPIETATDMYAWTGEVIRKDPMVVFSRKVKPPVPRILTGITKNVLT